MPTANMTPISSLPIPAETQRRLNEHDRRWPIKFGMRAVATAFCLYRNDFVCGDDELVDVELWGQRLG